MPELPPLTTLLLAAGAAGAAIGLAILAAALLALGAEEHDLGNRLRAVVRPAEIAGPAQTGRGFATGLQRPFLWLGEVLRDNAIISAKEVADFQRTMTAAGLDARRAVPIFMVPRRFCSLGCHWRAAAWR